MSKAFLLSLLFSLFLNISYGQVQNPEEDAFFLRTIHDLALTQGRCYPWLEHLTTQIGGRLAGSPQAAAAVEYTKQMLDTLGLDSVWLEPCKVPHWVRGDKEQVRIVNSAAMGSIDLKALALGNSTPTPAAGIVAEVVEVKSLEEAEQLGKAGQLTGKIVFYNRPMEPTQLRTFNAYGGAVDQRVNGPAMASRYGAVAALVRSMTTKLDDVPHTGVTVFDSDAPAARDRKSTIDKLIDGSPPSGGFGKAIPALAISTNDAELLSSLLQKESLQVYVWTNCQKFADKTSYNVIGEIRGSTHPEEIILVGGHLDSWDVGQGAHDDGAGCVQSMDVLQLIKRLDYKPKRTIRCVLFMNEENGLAGGLAYAAASDAKDEFHLAAIESDAGGFTPRGFSSDGEDSVFTDRFKKVIEWLPLLEAYDLRFSKGGSGADISPLKSQKGLLFGFRPDSQRYFDYHHTADDTIDAVNKRELELGAAAITSLVYLIDKYGL
jgi:hypothetical protein